MVMKDNYVTQLEQHRLEKLLEQDKLYYLSLYLCLSVSVSLSPPLSLSFYPSLYITPPPLVQLMVMKDNYVTQSEQHRLEKSLEQEKVKAATKQLTR